MSKVDFTAHVHPVAAVACPTCGAAVDSPCRRPSGHNVWGGEFHASRKQLADRIHEKQGDPAIDNITVGTPEHRTYGRGIWRYGAPMTEEPADPEKKQGELLL